MSGQPKLRDQAYQAFTQHLLKRQLLPGQFVSQRELAELTSMSLASIHQMVPRLEAEGLIKVISQRGLQIAHVDLQMVVEAFQLREMVEMTALAEFGRHASPREITTLYDRLQEIKAVAGRGPVTPAFLEEAQAADWEMHDTFIAAMRNRLITDIHRVNSLRIRMILGERIGLPAARLPVALREHEAVLAALVRRDVDAALLALRAHLHSSRRRSLSVGPFDESESVEPGST
ncbi:GntR family transcriptional regulator [Telmatospirillum siberiense]|uniref:GntR family transcriptional regulator n=1 Tax=Telmatospirillum siberiense TaxID=382514 RepID=A0A2N3PQY2_9PROT|nr:GntR family transcriptional regulator [Telmatospirillum siberiense]PKU22810.1 GntR family transcriptional regulator [Telmatospirillum siberiense]